MPFVRLVITTGELQCSTNCNYIDFICLYFLFIILKYPKQSLVQFITKKPN